MGWAEKCLSILLDTKNLVPQHVTNAAKEEQYHADQRQKIPLRQRPREAVPLRYVAKLRVADQPCDGEVAGIQHAMPWGEEGFEFRDMVVRPTIQKQTNHEPQRHDDGSEVEAQASGGIAARPFEFGLTFTYSECVRSHRFPPQHFR